MINKYLINIFSYFRTQLTNLLKWYSDVKKSKNHSTKVPREERAKFLKVCNEPFWIGAPDIREKIKNKDLDPEKVKSDLEFLRDQRKGGEKMVLGTRDRRYEKKIEQKMERKRRKELQFVPVPAPVPVEESSEVDHFDIESDSEEDYATRDPDYQAPLTTRQRKIEIQKQKSARRSLKKDFVDDIVITAAARNVSCDTVMQMSAGFVVGHGDDVNDYPISGSNIKRKMKKAITESAREYKREINDAIEEAKFPLILMTDGKLLTDTDEGRKKQKDRLVIIANIDGNKKCLGIPATQRGDAEAQFDAILETIDKYPKIEISKIYGCVFDTCAVNTGQFQGINVRMSENFKHILLEFACRRHIMELHIKKFCEELTTRSTKGPENMFFKLFKSDWNDIKDRFEADALANVTTYDVKSVRGTFLESKIVSVTNFCKMALHTNVFERGDYSELLELTLKYLCPETEIFFREPGDISHARFMHKVSSHSVIYKGGFMIFEV